MVGLTEIVASIGGSAFVAAGYLFQATRSLRDKFGDDYQQLRNYRASEYRAELHDIFMDVVEEVDLVRFQVSENKAAVFMDAMDVVVRDSMETVEEALRKYDELAEKVETAEENYAKAVRQLAVGGVFFFATAIILSSQPLVNNSGELALFVGTIGSGFILSGLGDAKNAFEAERYVSKAIRDYKNNN